MHVPVEVQIWRVAVLALLGIATNLLFHAYRAYRSVFTPKSLRYHLLDALVALLTFGGVGAVVFIVNWGEIRLYVPASLAAGFFTGNILVGDLTYRSSRLAFQRVRRSMRWARRKLIDPPKKAAEKAFQWAKTRLLQPLEPPWEEPPEEPPSSPSSGSSLDEGGATKPPE